MKDVYELIQESLLGFNFIEEEIPPATELEVLLDTSTASLPKIDCELDAIVPVLGEDRIQEYVIRKQLLKLAKNSNSVIRDKAREILWEKYKLKIIK